MSDVTKTKCHKATFNESVKPSEKDVFSMAVGRTVR